MTKKSFTIYQTPNGAIKYGHPPATLNEDELGEELLRLYQRMAEIEALLSQPPQSPVILETFDDWNAGATTYYGGQRMLKALNALGERPWPPEIAEQLRPLITGEGWPLTPYLPMMEARWEAAQEITAALPQSKAAKPARYLICQKGYGSRGLFKIEDITPPEFKLVAAYETRGLRNMAFDEGQTLMGRLENLTGVAFTAECLAILNGEGWHGQDFVKRVQAAFDSLNPPTPQDKLQKQRAEEILKHTDKAYEKGPR